MANVYSVLLAEFGPPEEGTVTLVPTISGLYTIVVRDMVATFSGPSSAIQTSALTVIDGASVPLMLISSGAIQVGAQYHWEGRQVLESGDKLSAVIQGVYWSLRVSGYQLTNP